MNFKNKNIIVGICGGIASYKTADLVSKLRQKGANVKCIMTSHAQEFVKPVVFGELSGNQVFTDMFGEIKEWDVEHISLAMWADIFVIAPATANILGKCSNGIADDMLSTTLIATKKPVLFVPSMNSNMFENQIVQENIAKLKSYGYYMLEPDIGHLACNVTGKGRFPKTEKIIENIDKILNGKKSLSGKKVVVTAGGTKEEFDPVRYIGNYSSGLMGYSIAKAAAKEDAEVILISTENFEEFYENLKIKKVKTANEMRSASLTLYDEADVFIMAAAVADYRPEKKFTKKVKKENIENLCINLVKNPDILMELGKNKKTQFLVGFAAETSNLIENGLKKLKNKNLDMLIANDVTQSGAGFESKTNIVSVIYKDGKIDSYPKMSKIELGEILINKISSALE